MMRAVVVVFALLCVSVLGYEKDGDVLVLTDKNIDDAIKEHEFILVEFYAPWCGHCKNLAPEYAKAATVLSALEKPVALAKVDATQEPESAAKFGVRGYPTLKWFVNGHASEYNGGRTKDEIVTWIKKKSGPPASVLSTAEALESLKSDNEVVVVIFAEADSEHFKVAESAARVSDDTQFAAVHDASIAGSESFPSIVLFKKFDEGRVVFQGDLSSEAVLEFVKSNSLPLVNIFSQQSASKIFGSGIENHLLYFNTEGADTHEQIFSELKKVSPDFKGKTLFVYVPSTEGRVMEYFDLSEKDLPAAVLVSMGNGDMKKYPFTQDFTADNIRAHVNAFHNGELKPTLKSEEPPVPNDGPVKVVVGKTFNEIVLDETKNVLVEFYAPWCGHCKSLTPTWEKLGAQYANHPSVVIAKIDATANDIDHPEVSVRGFPTILYFPAGANKSPVTYEGGRDLNEFVAFLDEHVGPADSKSDAARDEL